MIRRLRRYASLPAFFLACCLLALSELIEGRYGQR